MGYAEDGTINLSNKPRADADRVRARLRAEPNEKAAIEEKIAHGQQQHQQMTCDKCGRIYWSLSGKTKQCPVCRQQSG